MKYTVKEINLFEHAEFSKIFETVIDHCPKFASFLYDYKPFESINNVIQCLYTYLESLKTKEKQALLTRQNDLSWTFEVKVLDEEHSLLMELNSKYKKQFGFPFIISTQPDEINCRSVINILGQRLVYALEEEINNGIGEIGKISTRRILELLDD